MRVVGQAVFILHRTAKEAIKEKFGKKIWSQPYNLVKEPNSDNMAVFNLFHLSPAVLDYQVGRTSFPELFLLSMLALLLHWELYLPRKCGIGVVIFHVKFMKNTYGFLGSSEKYTVV